MKFLFLVLAWTLTLTGTVITAVSAVQLGKSQELITPAKTHQAANVLGAQTFQAAPEFNQRQDRIVYETADSRPLLLKKYIERYNKKLLEINPDFHYDLVTIADRHQIDFRLLPAIAMKESGMCRAIPDGSFNCLGLGVHSKGTWKFESYEANFDKAAEILKKNYIDRGLVTPEQIMTKYTPHSPNGEWARGVNQFMSEIQFDSRQKGKDSQEENHVLKFVSYNLPSATSPASLRISLSALN